MKSYKTFIIIVLSGIIGSCGGEAPKKKEKPKVPELISHYVKGEEDYYQPDDLAGHIHAFNAKREITWEEHPKGKIIQKSNNMGFKENEDFSIEELKKKHIILVIGDSHTDGVVYNSESFPNRLELALNSDSMNRWNGKEVEVINAGVGYYGPQNYLGTLKKYLELEPKTVIVCMYTGNDFLDAVRIEAENKRMSVPKRGDSYYMKLWELDEKYPGFTGQFMNQVKYFKTYPEFKNEALLFTRRSLKQINNLCKERGIELIVTLLPSKYAVEPQTDRNRINDAVKIMRFRKDHMEMNVKMGKSIRKWLNENSIANINLLDSLKGSTDTLYWFKDYHLNHLGHDRVAEVIYNAGFNEVSGN